MAMDSSWKPSGVFVDIFGTGRSGKGRNCAMHGWPFGCGDQLEEGSVVVAREVTEFYNGEAIQLFAVFTHSFEDGRDGCRVGFLPYRLLKEGNTFVNKYYKVVKIYTAQELYSSKKGLYQYQGSVLAEMLIEKDPPPKDLQRERPIGSRDIGTPDKDQNKKRKITKLDDYFSFSSK